MFCLFVMLRSPKPQSHPPKVNVVFLVSLESLQGVGMHHGGLVMFRFMMQEILNVDQFFSLLR
jgi:hypothetical protein